MGCLDLPHRHTIASVYYCIILLYCTVLLLCTVVTVFLVKLPVIRCVRRMMPGYWYEYGVVERDSVHACVFWFIGGATLVLALGRKNSTCADECGPFSTTPACGLSVCVLVGFCCCSWNSGGLCARVSELPLQFCSWAAKCCPMAPEKT